MIEANIVDIWQNRIYPACIYIKNGIITKIEENTNHYKTFVIPGFVDAHIHIESSLLLPSEFAKIALTHGTICIVADPHEIANVNGVEGIKFLINNSKNSLVRFYYGAPSSVPATCYETSGASVKVEDIEYLMENNYVSHLSEVMNVPAVLNEDSDIIAKITLAKKFGIPIDGHSPRLSGAPLKKYIDAGIQTDHECIDLEEAEEKILNGMRVLIRQGSAAKNFDDLLPLIAKYPEKLMFCTDDLHPDDLINGHINIFVKDAIKAGYNIFDVLKIASKNPKEFYSLDLGLLSVGDKADFLIVDDLENFKILKVYVNGSDVLNEKINCKAFQKLTNSFNISPKKPIDFELEAKSTTIKVIDVDDGSLLTTQLISKAKVSDNLIISDTENDILKLVNVVRYKNEIPSIAFVRNFKLKEGAIATSISHDSHNILAVGADDKSICTAINKIIESSGGICVVSGSDIKILELPIAGLISDQSAVYVSEKYKELLKAANDLGCRLKSPFMTLSFLALLVIPELKLSDKGLFDVNRFSFVDLFEG